MLANSKSGGDVAGHSSGETHRRYTISECRIVLCAFGSIRLGLQPNENMTFPKADVFADSFCATRVHETIAKFVQRLIQVVRKIGNKQGNPKHTDPKSKLPRWVSSYHPADVSFSNPRRRIS